MSQHELNRVVFRDRNKAGHVDHEQIACAILIWFTVITAVDVVLNFGSADRIFVSRLDWWDLVNRVVGRVQPRYRFGSNRSRPDRKKDCW